MKYVLQVRFHEAAATIAALPDAQQNEVFAEFETVSGLPEVLDANQLRPARTASTVRIEGGVVRVVPGPDGPPGAALDGYYLCDVPDLETAVALAARIPVARLGGAVEIRGTVER